jgi:hypothetical protein
VLRTATDYGRLSMNPAEKIRLKKRKLTRPKPLAFGVVFHELLTGRRVFAGEDVTSTLAKVIEAQPSSEGAALPGGLSRHRRRRAGRRFHTHRRGLYLGPPGAGGESGGLYPRGKTCGHRIGGPGLVRRDRRGGRRHRR